MPPAYSDLVTTVPDGVALLDPDQRIVLTNAKAQDYLITLADLSPGSVVARLGDYRLDQLRHYDGWREIQTDTTPPRIFEVNVSCVREDNGIVDLNIPRDLVLVIRDVTADRQIRDRIPAQDRLAAVGQFAAGIAHDFNNILASIMLQPYIIQRQQNELRPRSLEALENITQQAERGAELIKQLLDFSRSSTLEMHPVRSCSTTSKNWQRCLNDCCPPASTCACPSPKTISNCSATRRARFKPL